MGFVRLAGLPGRRDCDTASDGRRADYARRYALFTLVGIAGEDDHGFAWGRVRIE